jgi:hypothetical protein
VLIDSVKNPELRHEMTQHIEGKFKVREKDPAQAARAELFSPSAFELDRIMTLDKAHETLTLIRKSGLTDFKAEDAVVISPSPCNCKKHAAQVWA